MTGRICPHDTAEAAQLAVPTGGRINGIAVCRCGQACHVRNGVFPDHGCTANPH